MLQVVLEKDKGYFITDNKSVNKFANEVLKVSLSGMSLTVISFTIVFLVTIGKLLLLGSCTSVSVTPSNLVLIHSSTPTNINHVDRATTLHSVTQPLMFLLCPRHLDYLSTHPKTPKPQNPKTPKL